MKVTSIWARWTNARPGGAGRCQRVTWRPHAGRAGDTTEAVAKCPPSFRTIRAARDRATNRRTVASASEHHKVVTAYSWTYLPARGWMEVPVSEPEEGSWRASTSTRAPRSIAPTHQARHP